MILEIYNNQNPSDELSGPQKLEYYLIVYLLSLKMYVITFFFFLLRSAHSCQAGAAPLFHPNDTINTLMQCRDLNVLSALHVNLHYMYKLWECVFFYFLNFNVQTA